METESKTVSFYTLGCKLNSYDTEWYREQFEAEGYEVIPFGDSADVTVVNTCTVYWTGRRKIPADASEGAPRFS